MEKVKKESYFQKKNKKKKLRKKWHLLKDSFVQEGDTYKIAEAKASEKIYELYGVKLNPPQKTNLKNKNREFNNYDPFNEHRFSQHWMTD